MVQGGGDVRRTKARDSTSHRGMAGSRSPLRLAITRPAVGVKPMVVSTDRGRSPSQATAQADAPVPRWATTIRNPGAAIAAARRAAHSCARPWNP